MIRPCDLIAHCSDVSYFVFVRRASDLKIDKYPGILIVDFCDIVSVRSSGALSLGRCITV
jgi:hypothetical protein